MTFQSTFNPKTKHIKRNNLFKQKNSQVRRNHNTPIAKILSNFFQKQNISNFLRVGSVVLVIITGILFGQGLLSANTVSSSAQQKEEAREARIITNFYNQNRNQTSAYKINELP